MAGVLFELGEVYFTLICFNEKVRGVIMKNSILIKAIIGMLVFFVPYTVLNYSATETLEVVCEATYIQCTLTVGIFVMVYNFYKEWRESTKQEK